MTTSLDTALQMLSAARFLIEGKKVQAPLSFLASCKGKKT